MIRVTLPPTLEKEIIVKDGQIFSVLRVNIENDGEPVQTMFAPAGRYYEGRYAPFTDVELFRSIEEELDKSNYQVILDYDAKVFTTLTQAQATIATKNFYVQEKESNEHP